MEQLISRNRRMLAVLVYGSATAAAYVSASWFVGVSQSLSWWLGLGVLVAVRLGVHRIFRLMVSRWSFVGVRDVMRLALSTVAGSAVFIALGFGIVQVPRLPLRLLFLEGVLALFLTATAWIAYRLAHEHARVRKGPHGRRRRVLLVGAGEAGILLARQILRTPTDIHLVGFIDDDPHKARTHVAGATVLGNARRIPSVVKEHGVDEIIITIPSASPLELRRIVEHCEGSSTKFRVLPGIMDVLEGKVSLGQVRPVTIGDLLGRTPVSLSVPELQQDIAGGVVLVTGAAGSIGAELARQIAANRPSKLIILDQAESPLFFVDLDLRNNNPDLRLEAVVADVGDRTRIRALLRNAAVTHVFHAAAYKHVPLMEANPAEAIRNNVGSTDVLLSESGAAAVSRFVLISTDKAVRPSNVMGATKRVCELLMLEAADRYPDTHFTAVRFGNVLGSNGSVVPIFRHQLESGYLTVTHPEVTRFFMTIPEAVQLVLTASVLPEAQGAIAMLDMGEPVRILDLARNMIRLSGLEEGRDVQIRFIGLRPGEKLHEELVSPNETAESTRDGRIQVVRARATVPSLDYHVDAMLSACVEAADQRAVEHLERIAREVDSSPAMPQSPAARRAG